MEGTVSLLLATVVGFSHAFEADHLVAVSNLVTRRDRMRTTLKDGAYWGMGHTSTILLMGLLVLVGKASLPADTFTYCEAGVGLMLIALGVWRLVALRKSGPVEDGEDAQGHKLAYGVGLVHGLAGSGALVLLVMTEMRDTAGGMLYLLLFGLGSVVGMLVAASLLGLPLARRVVRVPVLRNGLSMLSAVLCIGYGAYVTYENLWP